MIQTEQTMKHLTKIRLINWHYFTDETININGSVLFSGENASGKSTILDAIQLVLTTKSNRFNPAANEKSRRNLQGYVRCKTGEEGNTYVRAAGAVISYVALEFYEDSKDRYFVIGVKIDSAHVDDEPVKKWFVADGELSSLTFTVNGKPAIDSEFTQNGKRIQLERQVSCARENFKVRLGRLDDNFADMIIKSLAFKPMDKVKSFINQFILPENRIQTDDLQQNIRNLRDMQQLINEVKARISQLTDIISKADDIDTKDNQILVIELLIKIAYIEQYKAEAEALRLQKSADETEYAALKAQLAAAADALEKAQRIYNEFLLSLRTNETNALIESIEENLRRLRADEARLKGQADELYNNLSLAAEALRLIGQYPTGSLKDVKDGKDSLAARSETVASAEKILDAAQDKAYTANAELCNEITELNKKLTELENRIALLRRNKLTYPQNVTDLVNALNNEFKNRQIDSEARIFADLLEIEMPEWQNAVEAYLNTQRFNIIVEPEVYDIAAGVYDRVKSKIHSAGLVNTGKLIQKAASKDENSLADAVSAENRYAQAYARYLMGRVVRCNDVSLLKNHSIAITRDCMKYQGHVLQKIDPQIYKEPYIGKQALKIQLENALKEYDELTGRKALAESTHKQNRAIIEAVKKCSFVTIEKYIDTPNELAAAAVKIQKESAALSEAKSNPTFINLSLQCETAEREKITKDTEKGKLLEKVTEKKRDIKDLNKLINAKETLIHTAKSELTECARGNQTALADAEKLYEDNAQTKSAEKIAENYKPRKATLLNQKEALLSSMGALQGKYRDGDFGIGIKVIPQYRAELDKMEKSDLISYEEDLRKAQYDCEIEFRENFLAKMRENIENAEALFSRLNKSLKGVYYGNDSYKFELSANKNMQSLYDMITSDINVSGHTLFTSAFEEKYHAEMEDLFSKLTDENLNDTAVINELTDYRSYLDYDIQIISRDGRIQKFSKTYGEKSGGETQTPYYVAIAASFAQMYSGRETIRIIMLDEAFNNMDEDRIASMMQFFRSQNFQVILAAPPARMETIGEYVDSVYLTIHSGNISTVEAYYL